MLANFLLASVAGIMLFFTVAVAPGIFKVLPQEWASRYVRSFFPKYYAALAILCAAAGILAHAGTSSSVAAVCAGLFVLSWLLLTPQINLASDRGQRGRFLVLHGLSIVLNLGQLAAILLVLSFSL